MGDPVVSGWGRSRAWARWFLLPGVNCLMRQRRSGEVSTRVPGVPSAVQTVYTTVPCISLPRNTAVPLTCLRSIIVNFLRALVA